MFDLQLFLLYDLSIALRLKNLDHNYLNTGHGHIFHLMGYDINSYQNHFQH